ncbi:LysR substrate-binding domain-containing protein [Marinibacterium profundimaris]|uniref:LysR substrate-binding domain-containing protein n=1 Tax=Marinibacterium profundimaris TaxID=1679460 RepID=UPI001303883C|nr:LysR substrate-binding domain-containing protein [Marinibacterium profundimaris]
MHRENVPLNALRAFEAAGRKCSFAAAAAELHVTPAAISHHIKALEDFVGTPLFTRKHRAIELTDAGKQFLEPLTQSFLAIEESTMRIKNVHRDGPLRVRVAACIASKWLLPRLNLLHQAHPNINLEVTVSSEIFEFRYSEMDALIRLRKGDFTGMQVEPFLTEEVAAVCSPEFLRRHGPVKGPEDLLRLPLIHDDNLKVIPTFPNWQTWLGAAGVDAPDSLPGHRFDSSSMALDAALAGRGIALARSALAARDLQLGNLLRICDFTYPVTHDYFLVYPNSTPKQKQLETLQAWLQLEARQTQASWSQMPVHGTAPANAPVPAYD